LDLTATKSEVGRILDASLADLTEAGRLSVLPPVPAGTWDMSDDDTAALWTHGLPPTRDDDLLGVVAAFQATARPEATLGDAGLYVLGAFGEGRLAAVTGTGRVIYLPKYTEVHPQLRHLHPDGIKPSPASSSVSALVDCAWRWHRLLPVLARAEIRLGDEEVAWFTTHREAFSRGELRPTEVERDREEYLDLCHGLVESFRARDGATTPADFMWAEVILDLQ
jgi:hypothetical protein